MMVGTRYENWKSPDGERIAEIVVEVHHDGSEVVPLTHEVFAQLLTALGWLVEG